MKQDWVIDDCIGNWWRPNFEPPQVGANMTVKCSEGSINLINNFCRCYFQYLNGNQCGINKEEVI